MLLNDIKPSPALAEFIRLYRIIDFNFPATATVPHKVYSPRPEHCLQFYPKNGETVKDPGSGRMVSSKKAAVIGQHTNVIHRYVGREFLSLQIIFQPGALFHLTGISSCEWTNLYVDAEDIFSSRIRFVNEQLFHAKSYTEMVSITERFLMGIIDRAKKRHHPVDSISRMMLLQQERFCLDQFIREAFLSHRQFDRKFMERVGIAPKQFLQIIRLDHAFRMKNRFPHKDWLSIAIHCGYHDYQHLSKEFRRFTGDSPTQFFEIENRAPERTFGDAET